jgi:hypothetical protein
VSPLGDDVCPRCGAPREPGQEYCLECGLRLPPTAGPIAALRRTWVRRLGWYPGDWIWTTLLAFVIAAAGAGVAIAVTTHRAPANTGTTFAATTPNVPLTTPSTAAPAPTVDTSTLPTPPEPTSTAASKPKPQPTNGATPWPASQSGWTVVLESEPATPGGRVRAKARAQQAARAGLPEVGVLTSSRYASLHPGYLVVFAGIYDTQRQAQSTLNAAYAAGFSSAYVRQIVR